MKRKSTGFGDGEYGFVGGHVEKNENIKKAIIRETKEEINIEIEEQNLKFRNVLNRKVNNDEYIDFVFETRKWKGNIKNMEPDKCSELIWCNPNNLPNNTIDFEKSILSSKEDICLFFGWKM